ncbi:hypothetical protein B0A48_11312 [Cryoendolithus antarcticus]|uniref:N-acetyltransferase domain-containing protein n=1 Tax=Cryoendolithus antarcticus TaxID=1507870 RepID=A0A1V8SVK5_9PEZI|nr:hypothetical protein B0A48_11312 [Cryoendolithus antarcticus]
MFYTERLVLRPYDESLDLESLWKASNDVEYRTMLGSNSLLPWTKDEVKKKFFSSTESVYNPMLPALAICVRPESNGEADSDKHPLELPAIGHIVLLAGKYDPKNRSAFLGVGILDAKNRGKGYGREAITFMLEYGFMELNVHRIELIVYSFNKSAAGLYRSIGFVDEGVARKTYFKSGVWHDTINMAILEEEWWEIRKTNKVRVMPAHLQ